MMLVTVLDRPDGGDQLLLIRDTKVVYAVWPSEVVRALVASPDIWEAAVRRGKSVTRGEATEARAASIAAKALAERLRMDDKDKG